MSVLLLKVIEEKPIRILCDQLAPEVVDADLAEDGIDGVGESLSERRFGPGILPFSLLCPVLLELAFVEGVLLPPERQGGFRIHAAGLNGRGCGDDLEKARCRKIRPEADVFPPATVPVVFIARHGQDLTVIRSDHHRCGMLGHGSAE